MFFVTLSIMFFTLARYHTSRYEWAVLASVNVLLLIITTHYDKNDTLLQWWRSFIAVLSGGLLCYPRTMMGYYQATIQLTILCSYAMLAYDVSQGEDILIYCKYETVIYGLVACQFIGIFTGLRPANWDRVTSFVARYLHLQRDKRT